MRRLVWVAIGAAGGIFVYKRAQQAIADAKERGVVGSAQHWGQSAALAASTLRLTRRPDAENVRGFRRDP